MQGASGGVGRKVVSVGGGPRKHTRGGEADRVFSRGQLELNPGHLCSDLCAPLAEPSQGHRCQDFWPQAKRTQSGGWSQDAHDGRTKLVSSHRLLGDYFPCRRHSIMCVEGGRVWGGCRKERHHI